MPRKLLMIGTLVVLAGCDGTQLPVGTGDSTMSVTSQAASEPRRQEPLPPPPPQFRDIPIVACDPADLNWRTNFFNDKHPLGNIPQIVSAKWDGSEMQVTIRNEGPSVLEYFAAGSGRVQLFQETLESGQWKKASWDWCGTGLSKFEIAPDATVELVLRFWDQNKHERMLARFTEKGTNRSGLVVLGTEPDK